VILDWDESSGKPLYTTEKMASCQGVSEATISEVCKQYEAGGIAAVLGRKKCISLPVAAKLTSEVETHIIAVSI
jgi:hypothetical protein